jgi:hypothetical protein
MLHVQMRSRPLYRCQLPLLTLVLLSSTVITAHDDFIEWRFRASVENAVRSVEQILGTTRNPRLLEDEDHVYEDKYALAEFLTNTVVAAQMNVLGAFGVTDEIFDELWKTVHEEKRSVTLRFQAEQSTRFVKEEEVKVVKMEHHQQDGGVARKRLNLCRPRFWRQYCSDTGKSG